MASETIDAQIAQAWRLQREGNAERAIAEFDRILQQDPDSVDANYGLGLALRAAGRHDAAVTTFQRTLSLLEAANAHLRSGGERTERFSTEADRIMMMTRMTKQRLSELTGGR